MTEVSGGTPPHQRGGPLEQGECPAHGRNTPASAGRTIGFAVLPEPLTEHPRIGGEDLLTALAGIIYLGTPPHRRGGQSGSPYCPSRSRNTPASAGRTCSPRWPGSSTSEHPRIGGEDRRAAAFLSSMRGTPPHRRGGRRGVRALDHLHRNTPASAGRTCSPRWPGSSTSEPPRIGGEDDAASGPWITSNGTPPHRQGGRSRHLQRHRNHRNTPASAGRTGVSLVVSMQRAEHPRIGGEDAGSSGASSAPGGTPPHRRGGLAEDRLVVVADRNTPASAGRTPPARMSTERGSEHPRIGGEDLGRAASPWTKGGTSPHRRGGRLEDMLHGDLLRNTPASAGRTSSPA